MPKFEKGNSQGKRFRKSNKVAVKYKDEFCDQLWEYFNVSGYSLIERKDKCGNKIPTYVAEPYPTFEGFAARIGVTTRTLRNWETKYRRFSDCITRAREKQLDILTKCALLGLYSPTYAKFEAINNHGKKEQIEVKESMSEEFDEATLKMIENAAKRLTDGEQER